MYECPNCAGNLKFDIVRQQLYCEYCGTAMDPYAFNKERDAEETMQQRDAWTASGGEEYEVTVFTCPQCGGQLVSEDNTAATFCSFCGASTILDSRISRERRPRYIIPFARTKEDCGEAYAKMMRRAIFAPRELKDEALIERFRGIYMPYWVYSFEKKGAVSLLGKKTHRRGDYLITDHYRVDCDLDGEYRGLAYDASASFSDNLSAAIAPFDLKMGKAFVPSFLSGFYADTSDVDKYTYQWDAEGMVTNDCIRHLTKNTVCRRYHVGEGSDGQYLRNLLRPSQGRAELAMLPVWFLSYRNGDRVSYAVVNGQTGRAAADLPVDGRKYLLGSMLLAVPLFFLLNLFLTITPVKILTLAAVLALVCVFISNAQMTRILARESGEDDKGLASVRPPSRKEAVSMRRPRRVRRTMNPWAKMGVMIALFYGSVFLHTGIMRIVASRTGNRNSVLSLGLTFLLFWGISFLGNRLFGSPSSNGARKTAQGRHLKEKMPTLSKPLVGVVAAVLILVVHPVSDWYYYIGAFLCMGMVLWAIMDIIRQHNLLTTRRLPQFDRRGGDDVA